MNLNDIEIINYTYYLITTKYDSRDKYVVIFSGLCNEKPFEGILHLEPSINSTIDIFSEFYIPLEEIKSIKRKIKKLPINSIVDKTYCIDEDDRNTFFFETYSNFQDKYYGEVVYLSVSFEESRIVKNLGAQWNTSLKKWFIRNKHINYEKLKNFI